MILKRVYSIHHKCMLQVTNNTKPTGFKQIWSQYEEC